jgi:hypothetical protein
VNSLQVQAEKFADSVLLLIGSKGSVEISLEDEIGDHAIPALESRGCVVQRELGSSRVTVYALGELHRTLKTRNPVSAPVISATLL